MWIPWKMHHRTYTLPACGLCKESNKGTYVGRTSLIGTPLPDINFHILKFELPRLRSRPSSIIASLVLSYDLLLNARLVDAPAGVTQKEGHTEFLIRLPSAVLAFIFIARRIQPYLFLIDREVRFCVPTN